MAGKDKAGAKKAEAKKAEGGKISLQVFPGRRVQVDIEEGVPFTLAKLLEQEGLDAAQTTVKVNGEDVADLERVLVSGDSVVLLENVEGG